MLSRKGAKAQSNLRAEIQKNTFANFAALRE